MESEPTGLLRTDKGKNARRELGKAEKNGFGYEDGNDFWIDGCMYRMCASNCKKHVNIIGAIIRQVILLVG